MLRRVTDIIAAGVGLAALSPVLLGIAIAIKIHDGGPVVYRARRVGRYGQPFGLLKFRSMAANADAVGPGVTASGDPRVTRIGRLLRRTKLDELLQLVNVIRGEMSLVGPRPEDPRYVALYSDAQREVLRVRPGMTSAASLAYRHEEQMLMGPDWERVYRDEVMPDKIAIDLEYLERRTIRSDLGLLLRTVWSMRS